MNIGSKLLATGLLVGVVGCGCLEAHVSGKALARRAAATAFGCGSLQ